MQTQRATPTGYTLIELLVVIALIAVLTAAVGLGLRGANDASALEAAGGIVQAQLAAARSRAALNGREAALALLADPAASDRYLREIGVAELTESGDWLLTADGVPLAGEIRLLPPADGGSLWHGPVAVQWDPAGGTSPAYLVRFAPNGALLETGGGELWWAAADGTARDGIVVSRYGAVVPVETAATTEETTP